MLPPHCYGTVAWAGVYPSGFSMEVTAVPLTGGDGFVDDEGWLAESGVNSGACAGPEENGANWVETGEISSGSGTEYFWANCTPAAGFMQYYLGPVVQSDLNANTWIAYKIVQDPQTRSTWNITISRAATGDLLYTAASTDNAMVPNTITEGSELAGQQGAETPIALFSYNAMIQEQNTNLWTIDGTLRSDNPPYAGWVPLIQPPPNPVISDSPSHSTTGGLFYTQTITGDVVPPVIIFR